jgi:hypothetical protein
MRLTVKTFLFNFRNIIKYDIATHIEVLSMEEEVIMNLDVVLIDMAGKDTAKCILRAELARRDISNTQLTNLLVAQGVAVTRSAVDNRISRGTFSADFFVDCLRAIGCKDIGLIRSERNSSSI